MVGWMAEKENVSCSHIEAKVISFLLSFSFLPFFSVYMCTYTPVSTSLHVQNLHEARTFCDTAAVFQFPFLSQLTTEVNILHPVAITKANLSARRKPVLKGWTAFFFWLCPLSPVLIPVAFCLAKTMPLNGNYNKNNRRPHGQTGK